MRWACYTYEYNKRRKYHFYKQLGKKAARVFYWNYHFVNESYIKREKKKKNYIFQ